VQFYHHIRQRQCHDGGIDRRHQGTDGGHTQYDPFVINAPVRNRMQPLRRVVLFVRKATL
jgi:hypothetical protein